MRIERMLATGFMALTMAVGAQALTLGDPATDGNCFPFGCVGAFPSSRYQQVYSASEFTGPVLIQQIGFVQSLFPGGDLNEGTYSITLSTSSNPVNALDTDFNANVGGDAQLFAVAELADVSVPTGLLFDVGGGGSAFLYDPNLGDLLLDIQITGIQNFGTPAFFDSREGTAAGEFSSAHSFGNMGPEAFADSGLVTVFTPEPASASLFLLGLLGLAARRRHTG